MFLPSVLLGQLHRPPCGVAFWGGGRGDPCAAGCIACLTLYGCGKVNGLTLFVMGYMRNTNDRRAVGL